MSEDEDEGRQLFERALESISREDLYKGKFGEPPSDEETPEISEAPAEETVDREELRRLRDKRMMEDAFGGIERMDQEKYHRRELDEVAEEVTTEDFAAALERGPEPKPKPEPEPEEPRLVELAGDDPETLNLRGMEPGDAIRELALFVDLSSKDGIEIVRIKVGSNPQLRGELVQWFRDAGAIYARKVEVVEPEGDSSLFVQLRPA